MSDDIGSLLSLQVMYVFFLCGSFQFFLTVDVTCPLSSSGHSLGVLQLDPVWRTCAVWSPLSGLIFIGGIPAEI